MALAGFPFRDQAVNRDGLITQTVKQWFDSLVTLINGPVPAVLFANLPVTAPNDRLFVVTDSTTQTWGAVITGGGAFRVLAWNNGSDWTVVGK